MYISPWESFVLVFKDRLFLLTGKMIHLSILEGLLLVIKDCWTLTILWSVCELCGQCFLMESLSYFLLFLLSSLLARDSYSGEKVK